MSNVENKPEDKPFTKQELKQLDLIRPHIPFLDIIGNVTPQQAETLIPYLKPTVHESLCTCICNSIFNYKKLDGDCKEKCIEVLKPKLSVYTFLSDKRKATSKSLLKKRGRYLEETSSGLPTIVSSVLPSLGLALQKAAEQKAQEQAKRKLRKKKKNKKK